MNVAIPSKAGLVYHVSVYSTPCGICPIPKECGCVYFTHRNPLHSVKGAQSKLGSSIHSGPRTEVIDKALLELFAFSVGQIHLAHIPTLALDVLKPPDLDCKVDQTQLTTSRAQELT